MNDSVHGSCFCRTTLRHLLLAAAATVFFAGCGQPSAPVIAPFTVPESFSDAKGNWERVEGKPTNADNQRIGDFFKKHAELIGSPDWTGDPEKFVCKKAKSLKRFYWFSGNEENPSWNAIEVNGTRIKQLSGTGSPGTDTPK